MNGSIVLRTDGISVRFGGIAALDGVDVAVREREIVGLIGPNGAGKTTLFNVVGGFLRPRSGRVFLDERDISHLLPYERAAAGVGRTFQRVRLFPRLTVFENLLVAQHRHIGAGPFSAMLHLPGWRRSEARVAERATAMLELLGLQPWREARPEELSHGTLRFLELAVALSLAPKVLLLDEPATGIAQREVEALGPLLLRVRDDWGASILLIEHDISLVVSVSDWVYALDVGRVLAEGTPQHVMAHEGVLRSYLGRTGQARDAQA